MSRLGAARGVLAADAGELVLSVNGCRLLPAAPVAAGMGRWGREGRGRCLLLGQVAISDIGSPWLRPERVCKQQLDPGCTRGISTAPGLEKLPWPPDPRWKLPATLPITPNPRPAMPRALGHAVPCTDAPRSHKASEVPGQGAANAGH